MKIISNSESLSESTGRLLCNQSRRPFYAHEEVPQITVGHIEDSILPVSGEGMRGVRSGHCGLPGAKLFTALDKREETPQACGCWMKL